MSDHLIIILVFIISILLWFYYIKSKDQDDKYIPVMIRQSQLINENNILKRETKKLKSRIKYLEKYKEDVSKTFRILDNELVMITDHINKNTNQQEQEQFPLQQEITSMTPDILSTLLNTYTARPPFNSLYNSFLQNTLQNTPNTPNTQTTQNESDVVHVEENPLNIPTIQ